MWAAEEAPVTRAELEPRACGGILAAKEFLILGGLILILADLFDVYSNVIRVSGTDILPFWGNHSQLHYTAVPELSVYDLIIGVADVCAVATLTLSGAHTRHLFFFVNTVYSLFNTRVLPVCPMPLAVCSDSIDGLVCSLCGFATCMLLDLIYVLWLCSAVLIDAIADRLESKKVFKLLVYTVVPYAIALVLRCYILVKAQQMRRSLKRSADFRRANEKTKLVSNRR